MKEIDIKNNLNKVFDLKIFKQLLFLSTTAGCSSLNRTLK